MCRFAICLGLAFALAGTACTRAESSDGSGVIDLDSDGHPPPGDCDDDNGAIHPGATEACNGRDDDCDGGIDEELGSGSCGIGACAHEVPYCAEGRSQPCEPLPPGTETCNGIDDDCDGIIDGPVTAGTCGTGACRREAPCVGGAPSECVPGNPIAESCNGSDDDCDGRVDNGFGAATVDSRYSELRTLDAVCDGSGERFGEHCNAAIHRFCASRTCTNAGFGPVEHWNDLSVTACVQATLSVVSWADLTARHPGCDGRVHRWSTECMTAAHRLCSERGMAGGWGPVETDQTLDPTAAAALGIDAQHLQIACVSSDIARLERVPWGQLAARHDWCQPGRDSWGPNCFCAAKRYCNATGHATGIGPVEAGADSAAVLCIDP